MEKNLLIDWTEERIANAVTENRALFKSWAKILMSVAGRVFETCDEDVMCNWGMVFQRSTKLEHKSKGNVHEWKRRSEEIFELLVVEQNVWASCQYRQ